MFTTYSEISITDDVGPPGSIIEGRRERALALDLKFSIRPAVQASDGNFHGTTLSWGQDYLPLLCGSCGTIFSLSVGLAPVR
jgi:hypothetical protein